MEVSKVIVPAAGLGTRFLPYTKCLAKEMLPIVNKPAMQYIIEEAIASEICNFIMITGRDKHQIEDYFDPSYNYSEFLKNKNCKKSALESVNHICRMAKFAYIKQNEPFGLGHAILMAQSLVGKEYFSVMLPDDLIFSKQPTLSQIIRVARQEKASIVAVQEVPSEMVSNYGIVAIKKQIANNLFQVSSLVEKPTPKDAPSNLAIVGRYVLSPKIFSCLDQVATYASNELQLTDGISCLIQNSERVIAYKVQGTRHDIGNPLGWAKCIAATTLQDPEMGAQFKEYLTTLLQNITNVQPCTKLYDEI